MKAIVIFWILISLSFLEATLPVLEHSTRGQEGTMIEEPTVWSKEEFLKCLEGPLFGRAQECLKIGIEKFPDFVKDVIKGLIRTNNVETFTFVINEGADSATFGMGYIYSRPIQTV